MPISLPDSTKFDADNDKISDSRPELKKISDAVNTLATEWNNQGDSFGTGGASDYGDLTFASETIDATTHNGFVNIDNTKVFHTLNVGTIVSDSAGDTAHVIKLNLDNLLSATPGEKHTMYVSGTVPVSMSVSIEPYISSSRAQTDNGVQNAITIATQVGHYAFYLTPMDSSYIHISALGLTNNVWEAVS